MLSNTHRGKQSYGFLEKKLGSLYTAAPIFLSMGLSLCPFSHWSLSIGACLGFFLSFRYKKLGFFLSCALWLPLFAYMIPSSGLDKLQCMLAASVLCSWWLTLLSCREAREVFVQLEAQELDLSLQNDILEKQVKEAQLQIRDDKKEKEKQVLRLEEQIEEYKLQVTSHRHHLTLAWQESSQLKEDHEKVTKELQAKYAAVQEKADASLEELKQLESSLKEKAQENGRVVQDLEASLKEKVQEHEKIVQDLKASWKEKADAQLENVQGSLQEMYQELERYKEELKKNEEEKQELLSREIVALEEAEPQDAIEYWENLYKQLRVQFDEKTEVLNLTRKEFFQVENEWLALRKEKQNAVCQEDEEESSLMGQLKVLEEECVDLEGQVQSLQDIISSLSEKKKVSRPKKVKSPPKDSSPLDRIITSKIQLQENLF